MNRSKRIIIMLAVLVLTAGVVLMTESVKATTVTGNIIRKQSEGGGYKPWCVYMTYETEETDSEYTVNISEAGFYYIGGGANTYFSWSNETMTITDGENEHSWRKTSGGTTLSAGTYIPRIENIVYTWPKEAEEQEITLTFTYTHGSGRYSGTSVGTETFVVPADETQVAGREYMYHVMFAL